MAMISELRNLLLLFHILLLLLFPALASYLFFPAAMPTTMPVNQNHSLFCFPAVVTHSFESVNNKRAMQSNPR
jgi:hypothetical protein